MSVKVVYDNYSDICAEYMYGKKFLELPEEILEALDVHFDGNEFHAYGDSVNPDNIYVNFYSTMTNKEVLTYELSLLSVEEYEELLENDELEEYVSKHFSEIEERLAEEYTVLGYAASVWHVLEC